MFVSIQPRAYFSPSYNKEGVPKLQLTVTTLEIIHKVSCFRASEPRPYARNDSIIHILNSIIKCVRTHRATHTVASAYTYIRIGLHIYTYKPTRIYVIVSGSVISCTGV